MLQALLQTIPTKLYESIVRPILFQQMTAQEAHKLAIDLLRQCDDKLALRSIAGLFGTQTCVQESVTIGATRLSSPLMLAAGFVKGDGFATEDDALQAVEAHQNIIPGWHTMPLIVGPVEFGSYTRFPRVGNHGTVIWRDTNTMSTQNRVGLKNPGARAAALFLAQHRDELPSDFGINIAVSPGVSTREQEIQEIVEATQCFVSQGVRPAWFTLNLSCPNTEDDPTGNQSLEKARELSVAMQAVTDEVPLWVKIGPDLSDDQYRQLMHAFAETGVAAVVATNTLGMPAPDVSGNMAGIGGGVLRKHTLHAISVLTSEKRLHDYPVAIIGCGGMLDGTTWRHYQSYGVVAAQYWSALVYRGPLAAAAIHNEAKRTLF